MLFEYNIFDPWGTAEESIELALLHIRFYSFYCLVLPTCSWILCQNYYSLLIKRNFLSKNLKNINIFYKI